MTSVIDSLPGIAIENYLQEALPSDLVLTASNRLAREITSQFARAAGHQPVLIPRVMPAAAWLKQCWRDLQFHAAITGDETLPDTTLLSEMQEEMLWEQTLRRAGAADATLFLDDTVQAAMRSAALADEYGIPFDDEAWEQDPESAQFRDWKRIASRICREKRFLQPSALPEFLSTRLGRLPASRDRRLVLAGFEEPTPAFLKLLDAASRLARETLRLDSSNDAPNSPERIHKMADAETELQTAAAWAREEIEKNPAASIAVVIPDLAAKRSLVIEIFDEIFLGDAVPFTDTAAKRPFNVSLGVRLSATPVARALLTVLPFLRDAAEIEDARALLRDAYFARAAAERHARARIESILYRERREDVSIARLLQAASDAERATRTSLAHLKNALHLLQAFHTAEDRTPSEWSAHLRALCSQCLWLGDPTLNSAEFQTRRRVLEELSAMAELDAIAPRMAFATFERILRRRLDAVTFQPESSPKPLLLAGFLEVTGLRFDAVWVCGLTDSVLPRPIEPDAFLPRALQVKHGLPRCDIERERAFAARMLERMERLAPRLALSYPAREKQEELEPSPLLARLAQRHGVAIQQVECTPAGTFSPDPVLETFEDWQGGALPEESARVPHGSQSLADQSACPFRAFARTRLGSERKEAEAPLMNRMDQGNLVHKALEIFWREVQTHQNLLSLTDAECSERLHACIRQALDESPAGKGDALADAQRDAEAIRLSQLLTKWIMEEQRRQPFSIAEVEEKRTADLGGIELRIRPDRIDQLSDGGLALIDYKTGLVKRSMWDGERPEQPQLLLYMAAEQRPVNAIAFASLKTGKLGWEVYGSDVPGVFATNKKASEPEGGWDDFAARGRGVVERLARELHDGFAPVDPVHGEETCRYCEQKPFCRIAEVRLAVRANPEEEDG